MPNQAVSLRSVQPNARGNRPDASYGVPVLAADDLAASPAGSLPVPDTRTGDLALLIYTSGSTGRPKGVMLDHANLVAMGASLGKAMKLSPDDNCLLVLPLFHVNAILVSCLAPMMAGAQVTILPRFAPGTFLAAISRYRATYFSALLRGPHHLRAAGRAARGSARRHLVRPVRGVRGGAGVQGAAAP